MPAFKMIVAMSDNNVIGYKNELPWGRLPRDLEFFKKTTIGHSIVVGYNTLVSISRMVGRNNNLLPGRHVIALTTDTDKVISRFPDCSVVTSIDAVIRLGTKKDVVIAGGQDVYHQCISLPQVRTIYVTKIHANYHGDAFFPIINEDRWGKRENRFHKADAQNKHPMSFVTYKRIGDL